jgi:transcriptional regulator with XRE-family HTH domain
MKPEDLKERRKALGLTQGQLAEKFGLNLNTLSRWENGSNWPEAEGMLDLALQMLELEKAMNENPFFKTAEARLAQMRANLRARQEESMKNWSETIARMESRSDLDPESRKELTKLKEDLEELKREVAEDSKEK